MGETVPVLDCTALTIFKVLFDRTRDWADIEDMIAVGSLHACGFTPQAPACYRPPPPLAAPRPCSATASR